MGGKSSKTEETTEEVTNNGIIEKESGGFHLVEIHLPTVGAGLFFFIFVALGALLFIWVRRRCQRGRRRTRHRDHDPSFANPFDSLSSQSFRPVLMPDPHTGMLQLQPAALSPRSVALPAPSSVYFPPFEPRSQRFEPGRIEDAPRERAPAAAAPSPARRPIPVARSSIEEDSDVVVI